MVDALEGQRGGFLLTTMKWMSSARWKLWHSQVQRGDLRLRLEAVGKMKSGFELKIVLFKREKWDFKEVATIAYLDLPTLRLLLNDADAIVGRILKP